MAHENEDKVDQPSPKVGAESDDATADWSLGMAETKWTGQTHRDGQEFTLAKPREFGNFELLEVLGQGGMGIVFRARQKQPARQVALKMIRSGALADEHDLSRFRNEVEAVACLDHPHVVPVLEFGDLDGQYYFSMKLVDGGSLSDQVESFVDDPRRVARLMIPVARAIHHAHQRGILHRDLKPANILVDQDGTPYITDFGLARRIEKPSELTQTGALLGTPGYMSPEQASGTTVPITTQTDVYGLGAVLYELLAGRPPFRGDHILKILEQVRDTVPQAPGRDDGQVPKDLSVICLKCLEKDPARRYESADALADDLERWLDGKPIQARPVTGLARAAMWCRRNPVVSGLAGAAALLLLATTVISTVFAISTNAKNRRIQQSRELAERHSTLALEANQALIDEAVETIGDTPGQIPLKMNLLQIGADLMEKLAAEMDESSTAYPLLATGLFKLAGEYKSTGDLQRARDLYERALAIVRDRPELQGYTDNSRSNLGLVCVGLGVTENDRSAALEHFTRGEEVFREILANPKPGEGHLPSWQVTMALVDSLIRSGSTCLAMGNASAARVRILESQSLCESLLANAQDIPPDQVPRINIFLGMSHLSAAEAQSRLRQTDEAGRHYDAGIDVFGKLNETYPSMQAITHFLGKSETQFGDFLMKTGSAAEAEAHFQQAIRLLEPLDPMNQDYRTDLAMTWYRLGCLAQRQNNPRSAEYFANCLEIREVLAQDENNKKYQRQLMLVLAHCAELDRASLIADQLLQPSELDHDVRIDVARSFAQCSVAIDDGQAKADYQHRAIELIESAIANDYHDLFNLEMEPDFDPLRPLPEFQALLRPQDPT